jgi:hypothetical protein
VTADIVLWLDLAEANQMEDDAVRERVPHDAPILRLTKFGADQCPEGTPTQWRPVLDAIDGLVREARKLEKQSGGCRYWVTGRGGLPAFVYLGYRLSRMAAVTFVHQPRNGAAPTALPLETPKSAADGSSYFERTPWPIPHTEATALAALVVSSLRRPGERKIHDAMAERRTRTAGIVHAHAAAPLGATNVSRAISEIDELIRGTCDAYAAREALAVFIAGPSSLAFIVGNAINPRACRDVQIFDFDGSRYSLAYELPYPAVPDRNRILFLAASSAGVSRLALDEEVRDIRLALSPGALADRLEIEDIPAARPIDIFNILRMRRPGAVHFSGHGEVGEMLFQLDDGAPRPAPVSDLAEALRLEGGSVRLVVLSACHSASHAQALLAHVECVVAMRGPIWDGDARRFSTTLYRQLAEGDSVRDAFDKGLLEMRLNRRVGVSVSRTRDIEAVDAGQSTDSEPPYLLERDLDCASRIFLVRRR